MRSTNTCFFLPPPPISKSNSNRNRRRPKTEYTNHKFNLNKNCRETNLPKRSKEPIHKSIKEIQSDIFCYYKFRRAISVLGAKEKEFNTTIILNFGASILFLPTPLYKQIRFICS